MLINHVLSNNVESKIFNSFVDYFRKFLSDQCELIVSINAIDNADIYHYYRPQFELKFKQPSVVTIHHDFADIDTSLNFEKNLLKKYKQAKKIICLNTQQQKFLAKYRLYNTHIIPHGVNKKIFSRKIHSKNIKKDKLTLGVFSRRYARRVKGEAYLYELVKRLDKSKFNFIFVGQDRSHEYNYVTNLGFAAEVYDYVPYRLFNELYQKIDLLLILSLFEGGPACLPEALHSATPVISRKIGMIEDYLDDNILLISGDLQQDINNFEKLADMKTSFFAKMCKQAEINAQDIPSWQDIVQNYENIYKEVVSKQ